MSDGQAITIETLENGLVVIIEELENVESAAYELSIPGGVIHDPDGYLGSSLILAELTTRGAGPFDSRELSDAFDSRGIRHSESSGLELFHYRGSLLADQLKEGLKLLSMMILEPRLPPDDIDNIKSILLQDLAALQDNPARRSMIELSKRYFPEPYGRPGVGTVEGLAACNPAQLRAEWERMYAPAGSILSIAGKCNAKEVLRSVKRLFGAWKGRALEPPAFGEMPKHSNQHIQFESAQEQITLAWPSARFLDELHYPAKVANGVLSGGMFGRLFIEVREKRGLVYSVYSRHSSTRQYGAMFAYAGTTPERAEETLQVMLDVMRKLRGTLTEEELRRVKANLKASIVIGEESSGARASSNANDYWLGKRVRSLTEILSGVEGVKTEEIDRFLDRYPLDSFMSLTLGSRQISQ